MKPALAKGTRDFSSETVQKRQYIISVLKEQFELRGYHPLETPSFENLQTLTGKYGEEGDRLIFKILRSGDFTSKTSEEEWQQKNPQKLSAKIADKALRYDLTVPFARYVVQNRNDLVFPFKRYQIQPVWRADRPQRGRFREFYQCDADVIGSDSLWQEVELIHIYDAAFTKLGLPATIKVNNRKILAGMAEVLQVSDEFIRFTVAIDKLDKIGPKGVCDEMKANGFKEEAIRTFSSWLRDGIDVGRLSALLSSSSVGQQGIEELEFVLSNTSSGLQSANIEFDFTLARGLNYYTGTIFEVSAKGIEMGSIGGGGRYADLTSIFGMKDTSGVGISFGLDRIYLCLEELNLFPDTVTKRASILFANFGKKESRTAFDWIQKLVAQGIRAELYPDPVKMKKQFDFANKKQIPFIALVGENEIGAAKIPVKNLDTGEQFEMDLGQIEKLF
ncbi:MAG: histidine--tRNA ligase [Flavobacteriales bacterium]|nr:histidine--tRNA ligase [Flavobacteriales bacterium]|tara:strand:- start:4160 stop:5500 length:1341 start_codon:yes stop_codon:yes gene_type:complete